MRAAERAEVRQGLAVRGEARGRRAGKRKRTKRKEKEKEENEKKEKERGSGGWGQEKKGKEGAMKELGGLKVGNLFHLKARARQASLSKQRGFATLAARRSLQGGSRAMGTSHLSESAVYGH